VESVAKVLEIVGSERREGKMVDKMKGTVESKS
jgi:hypothetical protein